MGAHTGKLEEQGSPGPGQGREAVFYAHGSESLRTALGKSKLHSHQNCGALLGDKPAKTVIKDWWSDVPDFGRCRRCWPVTN